MKMPRIAFASRCIVAATGLAIASLSFSSAHATAVTVNVGANGSLMFSPSSFTIKPGDTVEWNWKSAGHSVVSGMPGAPSGQFNSGILVPNSNPFVGKPGVDEIYAYGFRNPFRFSFDPATDKLIVGDVGQNHVEEIDVVQAGKNYGWNKKEGSFLFHPANGSISPNPASNPALINPIAEYGHEDGTAVLGGSCIAAPRCQQS